MTDANQPARLKHMSLPITAVGDLSFLHCAGQVKERASLKQIRHTVHEISLG